MKNKQQVWAWGIDLLFFVSVLAMTRLLALKGDYLPQLLRLGAAVAAAGAVAFGCRVGSRTWRRTTWKLGAPCAVLSLVSTANMVLGFYRAYWEILAEMARPLGQGMLGAKLLAAGLGVLALPAVFLCFCWLFQRLLPVLARGWQGLHRGERRYFFISVPVVVVAVCLIFNWTNAFYHATTVEGTFEGYDVIYNSDSGSQIDTKIHLNIGANQSDIRQPFYGLFAQPLGAAAELVYRALPFLPNAYPIVLNVFQVLLLQLALLLVCRMAFPGKGTGARLGLMAAMNASYGFLLFSLNMEQYVLSVWWLVLFLFAATQGGSQEERDLCFIGATGSILTTGVLFPLLPTGQTMGERIMDVVKAALKALGMGVIFARVSLLFVGPTSLIYLLQNFSGAGKVSLGSRLLQYCNFVASCFVMPAGEVDPVFRGWPSYQMLEVTQVNWLGCVLLALAIAGFWLNREQRFARICMAWVAYSFVILCLIGWGSTENGLVLYILYFMWAFAALISMGVSKVLPAKGAAAVHVAAAAAMLAVNLPGIAGLIQFGMTYYPA